MSEQQPEAGTEQGGKSRLVKDLRKALLVMLRHLRAGRRQERDWLEPLLDELHGALTAILAEHGTLHLRVGVNALYLGDEPVLEFSPREDAALFRLFQHGVRHLSFQPELEREDLAGLLEALTADLKALENLEEDITTLLGSRDLQTIHFVVVETFSESDDPADEGDRRAGDVSALVAAALRETLSEHAGKMQGSSGGGSIRFWSADVRFLEGANLPKLMAELPEWTGGGGGSAPRDEALLAFGEELEEAVQRCGPWLAPGVLATLAVSEGLRAERAAQILVHELLVQAREGGLGAAEPLFRQALDWIGERIETEQAAVLAQVLFCPELRSLAVTALEGDEPDRAVALEVLGVLPEEQVGDALQEVVRLEASPTRTAALTALLEGGGEGLAVAAELIPKMDAEAVLTTVDTLHASPLDAEVLQVFRTALGYGDPRVRIRALSWFAYHGEDHGVSVLGEGLRDRGSEVRAAALYLLAATHPKVAKSVLKIWIESEEFDALELDEKRVVALLFAHLAGDGALPVLRGLLEQRSMIRRQRVEQTKAAAVAGLGLLVDDESLPRLEKLAEARGTDETLAKEAAHVLRAFESGEAAYRDPRKQLADRVREHGVVREVRASSPKRRSIPPGRSVPPTGSSVVPTGASIPPQRSSSIPPQRSSSVPPQRSSSVPPSVPPGRPSIPAPSPGRRTAAYAQPPARPADAQLPPTELEEPSAQPPADAATTGEEGSPQDLLVHFSFDDLPSAPRPSKKGGERE